MADQIDYVKSDTAELTIQSKDKKTGKTVTVENELLWGDRVVVLGAGRDSSEKKVKARGMTGYVQTSSLGGDPLLEIYFIDVGQGDGVLIVTPNRRHILIDGGWPRAFQPTKKNAADFVDWKFAKDYGMDRIELDAVMCSHNDQDHYGGLWDLFNPEEEDELDIKTKQVLVERFFHAGLSWWKGSKKHLGNKEVTDVGKLFTDLIDSRNSVVQGLKSGAKPELQGEWAKFLKCATKIRNKAGNFTPMERLGHAHGHVPGFGPDDGDVRLRVLAPVEFDFEGKPAIRYFSGGNSKNTNGNSLLIRLDYGQSRTLLTGDLNTKSMQSLLGDWTGERQEFACDVAKGCHHGSDDVSYEFLQAMSPAVTVISSGDNEGHDHPRPEIVAASATTGHLSIDSDADRIVTPLIYSTELARSLKLGKPVGLTVPDAEGAGKRTLDEEELKGVRADLLVTNAGQRNPTKRNRGLGYSMVVSGVIYGLVNVRTNGSRILCATMNEAEHSWQVKTIESRF